MGYQEKAREKRQQKIDEEEFAQLLRSTRCVACQAPLLWHAEAGKPDTATLTTGCKLDQKDVMELAQAKDGNASAPKAPPPSKPPRDAVIDVETVRPSNPTQETP